MEVHLSPELQEKVDRIAGENSCASGEYVEKLVEHYLDHDAWFRQKVMKGLVQLDRGQFLTDEEVRGRLEQILRS